MCVKPGGVPTQRVCSNFQHGGFVSVSKWSHGEERAHMKFGGNVRAVWVHLVKIQSGACMPSWKWKWIIGSFEHATPKCLKNVTTPQRKQCCVCLLWLADRERAFTRVFFYRRCNQAHCSTFKWHHHAASTFFGSWGSAWRSCLPSGEKTETELTPKNLGRDESIITCLEN